MADRTVRVTLAAQVSGFIQDFEKAQRAVQKTGDSAEANVAKFERQKQAMTQAGAALTAMGAVAVAATALAVKSAIDWGSAWAGVTKTVDGNAQEMAALEGNLRSLARSLPATHQEIAAVAEAAGQLGVQRESIAAFTRTMIDLSETTNLTADEAATSIAQLMNVMQTAPDEVDNLGAALVALGNDGASTERDIVQMAQRIAGAGKVVGLSESDVLAFANALASVGIEAEAGGSAVSRVMTDIAMAVSSGGADLDKFAKVAGQSSADFQKSFKDDPADAIATFVEGLGRIDKSGGDVFATLSDLGQTDIRVSQALLGMANSGDLLRKSLELGAEAWEQNTALTEEAEKRYETTAAQLEILRNKANDAAITYGSAFLPAISAVTEAISGLLDGFAALPEGMQQAIAIVTAAAGAVTLMGGAFLLAVPKMAEFGVALATLRDSQLPGVARAAGVVTTGISKTTSALSKAAAFITGPWGLAIAAATLGITELQRFMESLQASTEEMTNVASTAKSAEQILTKAFQGIATGFVWEDGASSIAEFNENLQQLGEYQKNILVGFTLDAGARSLNQALTNVNETLGPLAKQDLPAATRAFDLLADKTDGSTESMTALLNSQTGYRDALVELATEQGINVASMTEAERVQTLLNIAAETSADAAEKNSGALMTNAEAVAAVAQANEDYLKSLSEGDGAFVSFGDALSTMQEKQKEWATKTAEDTESGEDSWQDYYDGFSVNLQDYLGELQSQIDAQSAWETNMILLSGRASQGVLDELARMGPEGAPLVAELVNATDEELAVMEQAFGEKSAAGTQAFAQNMVDAAPIIAAAGAQLGQGAAQEIAQKLAAGTATVDQIMRDYKLKVEGYKPAFSVDTSIAEGKISGFFTSWNNRRINMIVDANGGKTYTIAGTGVKFTDAMGGYYNRGLVKRFAEGGFEPGIYPYTPGGIHKFAEEYDEAYVSLDPQHLARSRRITALLNQKLGMAQPFASGGFVPQYASSYSQPTVNVAAPSLEGMSITGRLEIGGDGLARIIDGRIGFAERDRSMRLQNGSRG